MATNKEIYNTLEFDDWASEKHLLDDEKFLIEKYLNKRGKTLEAGTAAGRILLEMKKLGFESLHGLDYIAEFIEQAKQRDASKSISFKVQDALNLEYEDNCFDQIIYLQQIICTLENDAGRTKALNEAARILKPGGTALLSFLSFEVRKKSAVYKPYLTYIRWYRKLSGAKMSLQYLPWLKHGDNFNFHSLLDSEPYVYWYKLQEAYEILKTAGFEVVAVGSSYQINQRKMHEQFETLEKEPLEGMLYFVCKK